VKLVTNALGTEVTAAEVATLEGPTATVEARAFVVATGGIEVPRLLLASNDARPGGLGNENDLVGRHFTDHLLVPAGFAVLHRPAAALDLFVDQDQDGIAVRAALALTGDAVRDGELLGLEMQLVPGPLAADAPGQDEGAATTDVGAVLGAVEGTEVASVAYVQALAEQRLDPESRVTLDPRDRDALGMPRVQLDWRVGDEDRASIRQGLGLLGAELGRLGLGRLQAVPGALRYQSDPPPDAGPLAVYGVELDELVADFPVAQGFHHMCTTRMADDPGTGVVDADCRVHSVANLYIGGSAVFATPGISTPTLTITALALRLADHLRTRVLG
jgi:choline dehydrogenase-like flavoprotein